MTRRRDDERGVSEVLGFILAFSVVITSVGVVYVGGFNTVRDVAHTEQRQNAEYAMSVVGDGFAALREGREPSHESSMNLRGGSIDIVDDTSLRVTVAGATFDREFEMGRLRYETGDQVIAYGGGGVASGPDGWRLVSPPPLTCGDDVAMVPVVSVRGDAALTGGETVVQIVGTLDNRTLAYPSNTTGAPGPTTVEVTPRTPASDAWGRWLTDHGWRDAGGGVYQCENVERVYVTHTVVGVDIVS